MKPMDFFLNIRIELGCLAVITYIAFVFFSVKRRKTYVHNLFSSIIICSVFNLIFDIITVYTVNHLDTVPLFLNHLFHILFVGSTAAIVFCTYLYARALIYPDKKATVISWIPFVLSLLSIILLPIKYELGSRTNYSAGLAVLAAYACIVIYFILIFILLVRFHKTIGKKQIRGIITAILSILIVTSIQAIIHESLVSSLGVLMLNIAFFFTVENPESAMIEELEYAKGKADEANKAKSNFLANMSHEIRTPINAMLGMDEMILRETNDDTIFKYASNIKTAGNTLLSLINDILDFSKVEAGKMEIIPEPYDISSVIIDMVNMMSVKAKEKGLVLILHAENSLPKGLFGDSIRIKQCAMNLLSNAIKYTEHGTVTFSISHTKIDSDSIKLQISVKDTGSGIKKEEIEKIGRPFERFEETKYNTIEGSGLGLSIVYQLLSLMNSKLKIKSEYGKGTEFSFEIIQKVTDWTEVGGIEEAYKSNLTKIVRYEERLFAPQARLLFIDDTQMNLDVVKGLLKRTEIQLDTALSGNKALEMVKNNVYDIIFIDHRMPVMDGIETLHAMMEMEDNLCIGKPCIALTANAITGVKQMYLEAGFTDYLSKPVNPDKLEEMIRQYLPPEKVKTKVSKKDRQILSNNYKKIDGIDIEMGLHYSGSMDVLQNAFTQFYNSIDENSNELERLLLADDIKNYGIKIHSLKNTSRLIGAKTLSNQAEYLESCAEKNDVESINQTNPLLLELYRSYKEKLKDFVKIQTEQEESNKEALTEAEIHAFTKTLLELIENFDSQGIDNLIDETKKKKLPDSFAEKFKKICSLAEKIDYEALKEVLTE
ncbi:MAG: response regulator [Treponema sp.]|uniref:ATP-binding protein n=1 Tax=Treponema sp. TaxID=166 RepID=UPI0025D037F3|nr:ATP-binding protein [Treponema sp.]MBQ8680495.1 response regulator [Treponema sp.]MBR1639704.1 response regulator [Treponema sp.]